MGVDTANARIRPIRRGGGGERSRCATFQMTDKIFDGRRSAEPSLARSIQTNAHQPPRSVQAVVRGELPSGGAGLRNLSSRRNDWYDTPLGRRRALAWAAAEFSVQAASRVVRLVKKPGGWAVEDRRNGRSLHRGPAARDAVSRFFFLRRYRRFEETSLASSAIPARLGATPQQGWYSLV